MNENTPNGVSIPATISDTVQSKDMEHHNFGSFYNDTWPANQKNLRTSEINRKHPGASTDEHYFAHSGIECKPLVSFTPLVNIPTPTPLTHINFDPKSSRNAALSLATKSAGLHNCSLGSAPSADSIPSLTCNNANYLLHTKTETPLLVVNSDHLGLCIKTEPSQRDTASSPPVVQFSMKYEPFLDASLRAERVFHFTGGTEGDFSCKKYLGVNDHMCTLSTKASELKSSNTLGMKRKIEDSTLVSFSNRCSRNQGIGGDIFESVAKKSPNHDEVLHSEHLEVLQVDDLSSGKDERSKEFNCSSGILALADVTPEARHDRADDEETVEVLKVVHLKSRVTVNPTFPSVEEKLIDIPKQPQESCNNSSIAKVLPLNISQTFVELQDPSNDICKERTNALNVPESSFDKSNIIDGDKSALSIRRCEVKVYDIMQRFPECHKVGFCKVDIPVLNIKENSKVCPLDYSNLPKIRMHKELNKEKESISYDQKSVVPRMTPNLAADATSNLQTLPTLSVSSLLSVTKPDHFITIPTIKSEQITASADSFAAPSLTQLTTSTDQDNQPVKMAEVPLSMSHQIMAIPTIKLELPTTLTKLDPNIELAKANLTVTTQSAQISLAKREPIVVLQRISLEPSLPSADSLSIAVPSFIQTHTFTDLNSQPVKMAEVPLSMSHQIMAIPTTKSELTTTLTKLDPEIELAKANLAVTTQPAQISLANQEPIASLPRMKPDPNSVSDVPLLTVVPSHATTATDFLGCQAAGMAEVPMSPVESFVPYQPSPLKPWPTFSKPILTQPPLPLEAPPPLPPLPPPLLTLILPTPPILKPLLRTPPRSPAEILRMRKELVARRTYCSNDPQEKADNCSRGWDVLRFAKTSEQKFRQVRKRWGNPPLPNLNQDLSRCVNRTGHVAVLDKNELPPLKMSVESLFIKYGGELSVPKLISDKRDSRKGSLEHKHSRYTHNESQSTQHDFRSGNNYSRSRHEKSQHGDSQTCGKSQSERGDSRHINRNLQSMCHGSADGNSTAGKRKRSCDDDVDKPTAKRVKLVPCTQVYATKLNRVEMAMERFEHTEMPNEMMPNFMETAETYHRRQALLNRHRARAAQSERVYAKMREAHASAIAELELFRSLYQDRGSEEKSNFFVTEMQATEILEQEHYYSDIKKIYI